MAHFKDGSLNDDDFHSAANFKELRSVQERQYDHNSMMIMMALRKPRDPKVNWFNRSQFSDAFGLIHSRTFILMNATNTMLEKDGLDATSFPTSFIPIADHINEANYKGPSGVKPTQSNSAHYVNNETKAYTFVATRDIAAGESIVTHYTSTVEASCGEYHFKTYGFVPYGCHERIQQLNDIYEVSDTDVEEATSTTRLVPVHGYDLVGKRITVYDPNPNKEAWFDGLVSKFDEVEEEYLIRYDNGETVMEDLSIKWDQEEWRILDGGYVGGINQNQKAKYTATILPKKEAEKMAGRRISIYNARQKVWYDGTIMNYDKKRDMHLVHFDDGEASHEQFSANGQRTAVSPRWRFTTSTAPKNITSQTKIDL